MELAMLTILVETAPGKFETEIKALFNPNQITIQKSTKWDVKPKNESDTAKTQFTYGEPATLSMDLFFDTYSDKNNPQVDVRKDKVDGREHTREIFALTTVERVSAQESGELHRPPLCKLVWGKFNISDTFQCEWVLQSLNQRFTLFLPDGTPVRATLGCTFRQWRDDETEAKLLNKKSADVVKTRTVRRGDTLSSIAGETYADPTLWRPIAEANRIDSPRALKVGSVLTIPVLREGSVRRR